MTSIVVCHPVQAHFTGIVGPELQNILLNDKGFISYKAAINTQQIDGTNVDTPIDLTLSMRHNLTMVPGDIYSISCKMIGSNTYRNDALHFGRHTQVKLDSYDKRNTVFDHGTINKMSMVVLGIVFSQEMISADAEIGAGSVVITVKSVDFNPVNKSPVVWMTKHYVESSIYNNALKKGLKIGSEIQFAGIVTGYDAHCFMWELEVCFMLLN
ncbi:hypothetical protein DFH28DRAFT_898128 [Melampsora americana]|nr:hypothetical protein DFH28DRAFT_898128 [Melampsora americana]